MRVRHTALIVQGSLLSMLCLLAGAAHSWDSDEKDHLLIADQFNNRIVEIDRSTHEVVWHFGDGSDVPGPHSVVGPNDAERFGHLTLISGSGIPVANPPLPGCADVVNGCPDNRVLIVNRHGRIVWHQGKAGVAGSGFNELNTPVHAVFVPEFPYHDGAHVMITDQGNERVILVDRFHNIVWQYGTTGKIGTADNQLSNPNSAELLDNGHVLIADENNNRVIEVDVAAKKVLHQFTAGGSVSGAAFASRLANGDTLIADSNNNRAVEVDANDSIVWQYATNLMPGSNSNPLPTRAIRLANGHTLISDQFNNRVIEVTHDGKIVFQQGKLNVTGSGFNRLNGPYDAKRIGDFTGLTPPFEDDDGDDEAGF